jgi:hypothetical protein
MKRLHKPKNETVRECNQYFMKAYKRLHTIVSLGEPLTLVKYTSAFKENFNFMLRENNSFDLDCLFIGVLLGEEFGFF